MVLPGDTYSSGTEGAVACLWIHPYDRALVMTNRSLRTKDLIWRSRWSTKRVYYFMIGGATRYLVVQREQLPLSTPFDRAFVMMNRSLQAEDLALPDRWSRKCMYYAFTIGGYVVYWIW
jgi:hypothetical protein